VLLICTEEKSEVDKEEVYVKLATKGLVIDVLKYIAVEGNNVVKLAVKNKDA